MTVIDLASEAKVVPSVIIVTSLVTQLTSVMLGHKIRIGLGRYIIGKIKNKGWLVRLVSSGY